jgi:hypothetical protein
MTSTLFALLWPSCFVAPLALFALSGSARYRQLSYSAVHPFNIAGFLLVIVNFDFLDLFTQVSSGNPANFASHTMGDLDAIVSGLTFYLAMSVSLAFGAFLASWTASRPKPRIDAQRLAPATSGTNIVFVVFCGCAAAVTMVVLRDALADGSVFSIAANRQLYFRANFMLEFLYEGLVPAFILYAAAHSKNLRTVLTAAAISSAILLPIGSRSAIADVVLIAIVVFSVNRGKISVPLVYITSPLLFALIVLGRYLREQSPYPFDRYLELQGSQLLFGSADFSQAEAIVLGLEPGTLPRYPFETLVGMLLAPIPRAVLPWKPDGPSAVFTSIADPVKWALSKSEWVVTGFVNLHADFGTVGACVAMATLTWAWARALILAASRGESQMAATACFMSILAYVFIRGDLYNVALFLWPTLAVLSASYVCKTALQLFPSRQRHFPRTAR